MEMTPLLHWMGMLLDGWATRGGCTDSSTDCDTCCLVCVIVLLVCMYQPMHMQHTGVSLVTSVAVLGWSGQRCVVVIIVCDDMYYSCPMITFLLLQFAALSLSLTHTHTPPPPPTHTQGHADNRRRDDDRKTKQTPNTTLFLTNFDLRTSERDLERIYEKYGRLVRVQIKKTFAFVEVCILGGVCAGRG